MLPPAHTFPPLSTLNFSTYPVVRALKIFPPPMLSKTAVVLVADPVRARKAMPPEPFCVACTHTPLVVQVNVEGLVSVIARGVEEGFVTIASTLRSPTVGFANCSLTSLCTWSLSWSEATYAVAGLPPRVSASPALNAYGTLTSNTRGCVAPPTTSTSNQRALPEVNNSMGTPSGCMAPSSTLYRPCASACTVCVSHQRGLPPSCSAKIEKLTSLGPLRGLPVRSRSVPLKRIRRGTELLNAGAALDDGLAVVSGSCPRASAT